jgi:hypothetical protein
MEAEFDDAEALGAALASPEGQAVVADIPNYATGGAVILNYPFTKRDCDSFHQRR